MRVLSLLLVLLIYLFDFKANSEHVHIKLKVPNIIKKHTHVETKYIHIFHPTKVSPHGMVLRSDPNVYYNSPNLDLVRVNPKLLTQMVNTRLFYEKMKQKERARKLLNQFYSGQATEDRPVIYDFPARKTDSISVEDVYLTTSSPVKLPAEIQETGGERFSIPRQHKPDVNIKALRISPKRIKNRMYSSPKKYQKSSFSKKPFVIKVR